MVARLRDAARWETIALVLFGVLAGVIVSESGGWLLVVSLTPWCVGELGVPARQLRAHVVCPLVIGVAAVERWPARRAEPALCMASQMSTLAPRPNEDE